MTRKLEKWATVADFPRYEVSTHGHVRLVADPEKYLRPSSRTGQRAEVCLYRDEGRQSQAVAALVLTAFVGPRPPGQIALHLDGDGSNNVAENLRWGSRADMERLKWRNGTSLAQQSHCRSGRHQFDAGNTYWTPQKTRVCRACMNNPNRPRMPLGTPTYIEEATPEKVGQNGPEGQETALNPQPKRP